MQGLAFNYKNSVNYKKSVVLLSFIVAAFLLSCLGSVSLAYNWEWDQGHYCTDVDTPDGMWGRWDYDGVYHGNQVSKDCCELLCKICPVYANTGALQKTYTDLSVPGVGPALQITRSYSSQEWASTLLGYGWTFNFGRRLIILRNRAGDKIVGVRLQAGEKNFYKEHPDGSLERLTDYGATYDLVKNENKTFTLSRRNGTREEIQADGKISRIIDSNNNTLLFEYNAVGCLARITNASGNYVDFVLGPNGKIASVADNLGRVVSYTYDDHGNLIVVTDPMGYTTQYLYNSRNLLTQIVDARGNTVHTISYNNDQPPKVASFVEKGEPYTISYFSDHTVKTDSHGNSWTYYFNDVGIITRVIDPLGNQTTDEPNYVTATSLDWEEDANGNRTNYTYDADGNIATKTDPLGNTWTYTYVPGTNWMETETNPHGVVTKYEYDANGNLLRHIRDFGGALANTTTYTYDASGRRTSVTDPLGNTTSYSYDAAGNVIKIIDPLGNMRTFTYDVRGNKLTEADPNGNTITYTYDLLDRLVSATDALGNTKGFSFDANSNLVKVQLSNGEEITYEFDAYNRPIQSIDPLGNIQTYAYDHNDNLVTTTDANGNPTQYGYDALGRRISVTNAEGHQMTYGYDAAGNVLSVTDAKGNTTTFTYDALNRSVQKTYPDGANYTYAYDALGRKNSQTDPNGNTISYSYDYLNRLVQRQYPSGTTADFTYDMVGRMLTGTNPDSTLEYAYDALGRVVSNTQNGKTIQYSFDAAGNRIYFTTPEGETVQYSYNNANFMTQVQLSSGKGISYAYDALGRVIRKDYTGGAYADWTFDQAGRLTDISHVKSDGSPIYSQANTFDSTGNILQKTTEAGSTSYTYDKIYQLTDTDHPTISDEQFTYDPVGNRLISADYNDWNYNNRNEIGSYDGVVFTFDHNGNTLSRTDASGTTDYQYNYVNRLVGIDLPGGRHVTYRYDIRGRRIEKSVDGIVTKFFYDGDNLLAEYDSSGNLKKNYICRTGDVNPSILVDGGQLYFYIKDHLGTPQKVVDENGDIKWAAEYESFGVVNVTANTVSNNFRFPGQYYDAETGLHYNWHRCYDAKIGRYLSEDPIGLQGGLNLYIYVQNEPVNRIDPLGLLTFRHHGNWGGPGWSAGRYMKESDPNLYRYFNYPTTDARDVCYRGHDICLWRCDNSGEVCLLPGALSDCREDCDHKLGNCLLRLSPFELCYWFTDRGVYFPADNEAIYFHTLIPWLFH